MERIKRNTGRIALVAVLTVSLLGNALTAGALLRFQSMRADLLGPAAEDAFFSREIRKDLRDALAANGDTLRPALRDLASTRAAIVAAGTARPFDKAAVEAAMERFRGDADTTLRLVQDVVLVVLVARASEDG
ncbi:hypothetical protein M4578_20715 [Salipiger sp. P9]|uniref:hypothetical protein n=1 Tax=Salipiger pentaromativorans TaxID=2943193 RepID=UPI00215728CA|nr:hypothetical protein [Salipiger pentaromativorans]MCR8550251.1 hypothetical protein [Salipiger pentaromativorans]